MSSPFIQEEVWTVVLLSPWAGPVGHISLKMDVSCMMWLNSSAAVAVPRSQSIIFDRPAFRHFHLFQRFLVSGQKKKWTGDFSLLREQVARWYGRFFCGMLQSPHGLCRLMPCPQTWQPGNALDYLNSLGRPISGNNLLHSP